MAQVVVNRLRSPRFPNTICGVVQQRHQFSGYHKHIKPTQRAYEIAKKIMNAIPIHNYLYFNTVGPKTGLRIGRHLFW